ncbi:hypothetical protein FRC07_000862 [Ceratobasidium sp. 392]|nr:hypothetical protein FRC07_000862 [Ceratobasidium sp. 392]
MIPSSKYSAKLNQLRAQLRLLPSSLSCGLALYDFSSWTPDPDLLDLYGAECSVLNAHLESVFGLRATAPITFLEKGPGMESLVDVLAHYLQGDYTEKPVLEKWLDDLVDAATMASSAASSQEEDVRPVTRFPAMQYPADFRRPEAYERMAADKPGEEMAPGGTIWKLYLEEAEDHDAELVKGHQGSLDMLLLFAALFSAILTAFIIESKDLLQQDHAEASAALLLLIAQSQRRIELGIQPSATDGPVNSPSFSVPTSARWINGIWFTSLAFSLSAALIAMLGKEWLTAYLQSRPRHAYSHALLRQSRLEGLDQWWALHIIALLPSLLHLSLLLFAIGLVVYLWSLDKAIASVIIGVIGVTVVFYVITAILGAIYDYCPYVTQVSGYLQSAYKYVLRKGTRSTSFDSRPSFTPELDLRALLWLANNARDPAVVDCSYQALAGLRLSPDLAGSAPVDSADEASAESNSKPLPGASTLLDNQTTLGSLFLTVSERFQRLMRTGSELSAPNWDNVARYAGVLAELAGHIGKNDTSGHLVPEEHENEFGLAWFRGEKDKDIANDQSLQVGIGLIGISPADYSPTDSEALSIYLLPYAIIGRI